MMQLSLLKEWKPIVDACGVGRQTFLFRKGGLQDKNVSKLSKNSKHLFFPTSFHLKNKLLVPEIQDDIDQTWNPKELDFLMAEYIFEVEETIQTHKPEMIADRLREYHVMGPDFLQSRIRWKSNDPLTVALIRVARLHDPVIFANTPELWGCFSFISLGMEEGGDMEELWSKSTPCVDDVTFSCIKDRFLSIGG